ncbi:Got1 domain containing protein [Plasmodium coatneyi]|uniref:Got1 domain containing protein n=1 Tax=Plasmodium coatneyi TaxID=208452 RepID=A0A1B1DW75_9APIC|nr:Got1 domain containing protein [Plasmodium coatneyi]ANQ06835.1 Got1 domain containing protein [Plasmodium coatneyi]
MLDENKTAGLLLFFLGIASGTFIGFLFQGYGIYKLFFSFLPNIVNFVKYSPLSFILEIPGIKQLADYIMNNKRLPI